MGYSVLTDNGAPEVWHFIVAVYFAIAFVAARFLLDKFIFRRVAIWLLSRKAASLKLNETTHSKLTKCSESMWKLAYYSTVEISVLKIIYHERWFRDTKEYFRGWPDQELSIGALVAWETRRKDFAVMMSRHVITVILIGYSFITRFFRIGAIILALHDASDVFMEAAKVFKYSENELGASVFFVLFALSWLLLRLIFFPFKVIKTSSVDVVEFLDLSTSYHMTLYYVFNTLLLMLLVFHIYLVVSHMRNDQETAEK